MNVIILELTSLAKKAINKFALIIKIKGYMAVL
jgi:hypothetical protein